MQVALAITPADLAAATPVGQLPNPKLDETALAKSNAGLARRAKGQIAPVKATELVSLTSHTNFADGMAAERDCFLTLRQSEQANALRHLFFSERGAKAPAEVVAGTAGGHAPRRAHEWLDEQGGRATRAVGGPLRPLGVGGREARGRSASPRAPGRGSGA